MISPKEQNETKESSTDKETKLYNNSKVCSNDREINNNTNSKNKINKEKCNSKSKIISNKKTNFTNNKKKKQRQRKRKHKEQTDEWNFIEQGAQWGDKCKKINDGDKDTLRVYCQNVNGIYDSDGLKLNEAFHYMRTVKASVFTFNETHGDDKNPEARKILRESKQRVWRDQDSLCAIATSSSDQAVSGFCKPGGNMVGITGNMSGRIRERIRD